MNLREGMARLARGAAVAYWLLATAAVGTSTWGAYGYAVNDWPAPVVAATTPNPFDRFDNVQGDPWRVVDERPSTAQSPPRAAGRAALIGLLWAAGIYAALWAIFRALRWVGLGFLEPKPTQDGR